MKKQKIIISETSISPTTRGKQEGNFEKELSYSDLSMVGFGTTVSGKPFVQLFLCNHTFEDDSGCYSKVGQFTY